MKQQEDMLGKYEYPTNCDTLVIGACKYTIMWYELDTLDQIKFVILVKNSLVTTLGFSMEQNSNHEKSDIIVVNEDKTIHEKYIDENGEVQDIVENGISEANVTVLTDKNVLFVQFVKKLNSTKDEHVSIGAIEGVYYFVDGPSHDREEKYHWVEQKMDLSMIASESGEESNNSNADEEDSQETSEDDYLDDYFDSDEDYDEDQSETSNEQISEEHTSDEQTDEQTSVEATSNELTNVDSNETNQSDKEQTVHKVHGSCNSIKKFSALSQAGFKQYQSCENGQLQMKNCPKGTIFYFVLQCCVPLSKFPCKSNCVGIHSTSHKHGHRDHDYSYFIE